MEPSTSFLSLSITLLNSWEFKETISRALQRIKILKFVLKSTWPTRKRLPHIFYSIHSRALAKFEKKKFWLFWKTRDKQIKSRYQVSIWTLTNRAVAYAAKTIFTVGPSLTPITRNQKYKWVYVGILQGLFFCLFSYLYII